MKYFVYFGLNMTHISVGFHADNNVAIMINNLNKMD